MKILLYLPILFTLNIYSQTVKLISKDEVDEDVDYIKYTIEDASVSPYSQISKKKFVRLINRAHRRILKKDIISPFDFYLAFQPIIAKLRDGHTELNIADRISETDYLIFPFTVGIQNNSLFIKSIKDGYQNFVPDNVIGKKIVRIDGINVHKIIKLFGSYTSAETNKSSIALSQYYFNDYYNLFIEKKDTLKIVFEDETNVDINILKRSQLKNTSQKNNKIENFSYCIVKDKNYALLTIRSFSDLEFFKTFLLEMFDRLKQENITNLIIDIRENGGGNSELGDELLSYLVSQPFTQYNKTVTKYSETQKQFLKNSSYTDLEYTQKILSNTSGKIGTEIKSSNLINTKGEDQKFKGSVIVLISGQTFSSAADFANALKYYRTGILVGEESGGFVVSGGESIQIKLPNSKLILNISTSMDYDVGTNEGDRHGVRPDIHVPSAKALDYILKNF
ncbi:Peptidase family S41 [Paenimyroides ummariense]|uniref:Peptidase family S41 n=1 Tax=Paenimyroides ummariense TaxID=913024 RepID=A0A1I5CT34_9FLAO|nr:S41 family peptidase [Paenimyroides ummariense]SFN90092.1 Peptidase family S41 [Paenimyroides ummariense]